MMGLLKLLLRGLTMSSHSHLLERYRRHREVRFRLNNLLVRTIPKKILDECGRKLGLLRNGTLVLDNEDELSVLMDYCIYHPQSDERDMIARYLEKTPPPADSEEMAVLQAMSHAYYSIFQVTGVERGVGIRVQDLFRDEPGFIVDVGLGNSARRHMILATRIIPADDYLMTGGAGLPLDASTVTRIFDELNRTKQTPDKLKFHSMTRRQEADIAAIVIRTSLSAGMSSRIVYNEPGGTESPSSSRSVTRRVGRNEPCPCGSGRKFKVCCGRG